MRHASAVTVAAIAILGLGGCSGKAALPAEGDELSVVTTTGLLRDLVEEVGGSRVHAASIVPDTADPHSYEPTLRDARNAVYADVAFSNYALLEEHRVIRTLDANLRPEAINVSLAEESVKYAAEIIPLVEDVNLDTIWLGLRASGTGREHGADRGSQVLLSATSLDGPGDVFAYLTGSFGDTDVYFDSSDGFDASTGFKDDTMGLPADAHTHLSWAFTEPGVYRLTLQAKLQVDETSRPVRLGASTFTFVVGVPPSAADIDGALVLDGGHADLTADVDTGRLVVRYEHGGGSHDTHDTHDTHVADASEVVIEVPAKALDEVPDSSSFAFLGRAGDAIYQLPQAVLGKHVHGEIDPHLWQDVRNTMAYVQLIRDTLIVADPAGARDFRANASRYLDELERTDTYVRAAIAAIPESKRYLVTTHDAFAYLAHAYGIRIAGFVTANPAAEPSLADRRKLSETLRTLDIPAVFLEPSYASRASALTELADDAGITICPLYSDAFDAHVSSYIEMMRANADSLKECLR